MTLSSRALAIACGLVWSGWMLLIGLVHFLVPSYGGGFLGAMSSVYPGFHASGRLSDTLFGAGEALVDGLIGGLVFAWLYNTVMAGQVASKRA